MRILLITILTIVFALTASANKTTERNILVIRINADNSIILEGKSIELWELYSYTKHFLLNPFNEDILPEKRCKDLPLVGIVEVSKGIVSLASSRDASYKTFFAVQNELEKAYIAARNDYAELYFNKQFRHLNKQQNYVVRKICPIIISEAEPLFVLRKGTLVPN